MGWDRRSRHATRFNVDNYTADSGWFRSARILTGNGHSSQATVISAGNRLTLNAEATEVKTQR